MEHIAATETVVIIYLLVGIMGAWDGLVRRHVRMTIDVIQLHIRLHGLPAILVGLFSALLTYVLARLSLDQFSQIAAACQQSVACVVRRVLLPPFATGQTPLGLLVFAALFGLWMSGAGDLRGPFRRFLLAPGVWYSERDIVILVEHRLQEARLAPVRDDTVLEIASWVRANMPLFSRVARGEVIKEGKLNRDRLVTIHLGMRTIDKYHLSKKTQRIVVEAIVGYYVDTHERAEKVWPWRRRILGF